MRTILPAALLPVFTALPSVTELDPDVVARVGVVAVHMEDLAPASRNLPIGCFKNYTYQRGSTAAPTASFFPVLRYRRSTDTPEMLERIRAYTESGLIPRPIGTPIEEVVDQFSSERLAKRILEDTTSYPPGTLFILGSEPGYAHNGDDRLPPEIVSDARFLRGFLDEFDRDYRLALGGIATARRDFVRHAYRGRDGFDFWREILELAERDLFDAFFIHPYPTDFENPTVDSVRDQIHEARRLLNEFGQRERDLIVGETGVIFRGVPAETTRAFTAGVIELFLTDTDAELGHPGDGERMVQRFCILGLSAPRIDVPGHTDNPGLDFEACALVEPGGELTALGETFRDTVVRLAGRSSGR